MPGKRQNRKGVIFIIFFILTDAGSLGEVGAVIVRVGQSSVKGGHDAATEV